MPKDQRKRQQIKQRDAARRKHKPRSAGAMAHTSPRAILRAATHWPLEECLVSDGWQKDGALVQLVVARRSPADQIAAAVFLVDPGCLGVKDAYVKLLDSPLAYRSGLLAHLSARQRMLPADLDLVTKIIRDSIAYARALGFHPHPDYQEAAPFLEGGDENRCNVPVHLGGPEGKPLFMSGPFDDVPRILAQLERAVGPNNYHYMIRLDPDAVPAALAFADVDILDDDLEREEDADGTAAGEEARQQG